MSLVASHISKIKQSIKEGHCFDDLVTDWVIMLDFYLSEKRSDENFSKCYQYLEQVIEDYVGRLPRQEQKALTQQIFEDYSLLAESDEFSDLAYDSSEPKDTGLISIQSITNCFYRILDEELEESAVDFKHGEPKLKRASNNAIILRITEEVQLGYLSTDSNVKEFSEKLLIYLKGLDIDKI